MRTTSWPPLVNTFLLGIALAAASSFVKGSPIGPPSDSDQSWEEEPLKVVAPEPGNIGCLLTKGMCDDSEWCFNDNAFGRCLPIYGLINDETLYRFELSPEDSTALENEMEKLFDEGHRWRHAYTQCMLQNYLDALRFGGDFEAKLCEKEEKELDAIEAIEDELDPLSLALIKFKPSASDPNPDYADELYIPGLVPEAYAETFPYVPPPRGDIRPDLRAISAAAGQSGKKLPPKLSPDEERLLEEALENIIKEEEAQEIQSKNRGRSLAIKQALKAGTPKRSRADEDFSQAIPEPRIFNGIYNSPESFRHGLETRDVMAALERDANSEEEEDDSGVINNILLPQEDEPYRDDDDEVEVEPMPDGNGLIFLNQNKNQGDFNQEDSEDDGSRYILEELAPSGLNERSYGSGFERQERLDVKKPGPWFRNVNNFGFDNEPNMDFDPTLARQQEEVDFIPEFESGELSDEGEKEIEEDLKPQRPVEVDSSPPQIPQLYQPVRGSRDAILTEMKRKGQSVDDLDIIESDYVHLVLSGEVPQWTVAHEIVQSLAEELEMPGFFTEIQINKNNVVTFRVRQPNNKGLNASQVAEKIEKLSGDVESSTRSGQIRILSAGVGKTPNVSWELLRGFGLQNGIFYWTMLASGLVGACLLSALGIFFIRRHAKSKEKFAQLAQDDPGGETASKDYQELCRARMATKSQVSHSPVRTSSVKKSGEHVNDKNGSPSRSSSSSSSSWNEEPCQTQLDISTGHMVLAYMEDHLKKKDRLDEEWAALCAYEAEPCATIIAEKPENAAKNRYTNALPYDHSRVILNELANASSDDYINASTITDHDPRNPAYIATQGPLKNTVADFWQMVWEQGAVVIVSLTRLNENGTTLCHRYWPDEGSELHHIYEVHLVSEHIWCDEYLVRSFYLKNLKTAETRTVTQFHFLAWPENGIPSNMKALLEFRRKVNKSYRGRSCPIIIHCSDGAGRSGTYCLIDMVLNRMSKGAKEIDIAASLEHIRDQRPGMVKTKQQFEFVLSSVAEEVHAILKALPQ